MKKHINIHWKKSLLFAVLFYLVRFIFGADFLTSTNSFIPLIVVSILEIIAIFALLFGVIGGIKSQFPKKDNNKI